MRASFFSSVILLTGACQSHGDSDISYAQYVDVLTNADATINELSATTGNPGLDSQLNATFQSISENTELNSTIPRERLEQKSELLDRCLRNTETCQYVPEGFDVIVQRNFLNVKYQYNAFSSYDVFYKYRVVDLKTAALISMQDILKNPSDVLKLYEAKYTQDISDYLTRLDGNNLREDEGWEYEVLSLHLETREPFGLKDLDNFALVYDAPSDRFTGIRFYYNGAGGHYRQVLSSGFIEFEFGDIQDLLQDGFVSTYLSPGEEID